MRNHLLLILVLILFSPLAKAVDYADAKITGIGLANADDHIRFTIDKDPSVIFTTTQFSGEQLKRLVSLIYSAYTAQSPLYMIRSGESSSSGVLHYTNVLYVSVGGRTWD